MTTTSREIHLVKRPQGAATPDDFALRTVELPDPGDGEVLVRNEYVSVDPYMRGRMNDAKSYAAPYQLDQVMHGGAVGRVVKTNSEIAEGTLVSTQAAWREAWVGPAKHVQVLPEPPAGHTSSVFLGALGMTAMTAWIGLDTIAPVQTGDVVFVSAAAGAVGSIAGQIAKVCGASLVVGSAGADEKVRAVTEDFGFDAAFSYRDGKPLHHLRAAAPGGVDVYFDNVGGEQLNAAILHSKPFGRFALCGGISSGYDGSAGEPITALGLAVGNKLTLRGFIVSDHFDQLPRFYDEMTPLVADGTIRYRETVYEGVENAVEAFLALFAGGGQIGKVVVKV